MDLGFLSIRSRQWSFIALPCPAHLLDFGAVFAPTLSLLICRVDKMWPPAAGAFAVTLAEAVLLPGSRNWRLGKRRLWQCSEQTNNWGNPLKGVPASFLSPKMILPGISSSKPLVSLNTGFYGLLELVVKLLKEDLRATYWILIILWVASQLSTQEF